ncbi:MAG TPA: GNAT family N-acetyltransferase [Pyrinomonadaceae bacterium]|jgi:N-acetylglutamate synthase-like GNAT family acetyltransferase
MKIRPVTKRDILPVIKLIGDVWAEYDCVLDAEKEETYLLAPDEYFRAKGGEFWVVVEKNEIVATVAVQMLDAKTAELKTLYVHKDFRRAGLGENLTTLAIKYAEMKRAREIILWSDTRFTKAHHLYERLGFKRISYRELDDLNSSKEFGFRLYLK